MMKMMTDDDIPCVLVGFGSCDIIATYTYRSSNGVVSHVCKTHYRKLKEAEKNDK